MAEPCERASQPRQFIKPMEFNKQLGQDNAHNKERNDGEKKPARGQKRIGDDSRNIKHW